MRLTVDRTEGSYVLCETPDRTILAIPAETLPQNLPDGAVLEYDGTHAILLEEETLQRKKALSERLSKLFQK
ncbi:MAG: DUF3006 domain-containing protein [Lachnospiraceae bacterium]|nr:DUF3006 domain-containing protein [Lachnospiraceae bacterium]